MDSLSAADQQLRRSLEAELLYLFRAERRHADFRNPDRQRSDFLYLADPLRPFIYIRMVPIEREPVQCNRVDIIQAALRPHFSNVPGIDRLDSAQHAGMPGDLGCSGCG